jgi:hypothetical protein
LRAIVQWVNNQNENEHAQTNECMKMKTMSV